MYKEGRTTIYEEGDKLGPYSMKFIEEKEPIIYSSSSKARQALFECCHCGKIFLARITSVKNGTKKSCGCIHHPDLTGQQFEKLTVIRRVKNNKHGSTKWLCQCACGKQTEVLGTDLRLGKTKSCGCFSRNIGERRFKDLTGQQFGLLTVISQSKQRRNNKIMWLCQCKCGKYTTVAGSDLTTGNTASCGCKHKSMGEINCENSLINSNIQYYTQYSFDNCYNPNTNKLLKFDFYLPEYNICIECDGQQHFNPVSVFGGKEAFRKQQQNDEIKNQYCKDNNITLIRIPYWDYDKLDEEYLLSLIEGK